VFVDRVGLGGNRKQSVNRDDDGATVRTRAAIAAVGPVDAATPAATAPCATHPGDAVASFLPALPNPPWNCAVPPETATPVPEVSPPPPPSVDRDLTLTAVDSAGALLVAWGDYQGSKAAGVSTIDTCDVAARLQGEL